MRPDARRMRAFFRDPFPSMNDPADPAHSRLRRAMAWLGAVEAADPVRRALNAGLAWVLLSIAALAILMAVVLAAIGRPATPVVVVLVTAPVCLLCWWINRRGSALGAMGFVALMIGASTLAVDPHLYAGPAPMVDVAFMYGIVAAALFVRPLAGLVALAGQLVALSIAMAVAHIPPAQAFGFLAEAVIEMGAMAALLVVAATIFVRALEETQRRAEALARSEARSRRLVEANVVGIVITDLRGRVKQANDAFLHLLGLTRAEFESGALPAAMFVPPDKAALRDAALEAMRTIGRATCETELERKDGTRVPVLASWARFENFDEGVAFVLDLTEQRRVESERRARVAAEAANQAKTTFLANMSHELRTPLNGILGFAQLLALDPQGSAVQQRQAGLIRESGEHLLGLIEEILDIARIEAGRLELYPAPLDLRAFIDAIASMARVRCDAAGIGFVCEVGASVPATIVADEKRLRQVLLNLVDNAAKFTDSGKVTLRVGRTDGDGSLARLRFDVEDTGCGIAPEHVDRVFRPFEQVGDLPLRRAGAGLGLAISQQLVSLMHGRIRVTSTPGRGSTFGFDIAVPSLPRAASRPAPAVPSGYEGRPRTVLVADDVARNRALLRDVLLPLGFQVHEAADGQEATDIARRIAPDLVLIDAVMPVVDGVAAIAAMRSLPALRHTPIVAISASAMAADRRRCLDAGADVFLAKPIDVPVLLGEVQRLLKLQWSARGVARV